MGKPLPKRVDSSDCAVKIGDETYYPHEGEWVELFVGQSVGELQGITQMRRLGVEMQAIQGESDQNERALDLIEPVFDTLCNILAGRIVNWNWTDDAGRPLPAPDGTPQPLKRLRAEELNWLLSAGQGETPAQRKNALAPSLTTCSDTESQATGAKPSTTGRSRKRA